MLQQVKVVLGRVGERGSESKAVDCLERLMCGGRGKGILPRALDRHFVEAELGMRGGRGGRDGRRQATGLCAGRTRASAGAGAGAR